MVPGAETLASTALFLQRLDFQLTAAAVQDDDARTVLPPMQLPKLRADGLTNRPR